MKKTEEKELRGILRSYDFTQQEIDDAVSQLEQGGSVCLYRGDCDSGEHSCCRDEGCYHDQVWLRAFRVGNDVMVVMEEAETQACEDDTEGHELYVLAPNDKAVIVWGWRKRILDQSKARVLYSFRDSETEILAGAHLLGSLADIPEDWWHSSGAANGAGSRGSHEPVYGFCRGAPDVDEVILARLRARTPSLSE